MAGTAALLTAGGAFVLPSAWAGPSSEAAACEDGEIPLVDVTVTTNGQDYEATWLVDHYSEINGALDPLDQVVLTYDPDDDLTTVDAPEAGCSRGFQLEAFTTDGPSFDLAGQQVWSDGDGATMSADQQAVALEIAVPQCYYQNDLSSQGATFEESDYFDGHDAGHPLPVYPDVRTPYNLIAAVGGGQACVAPEVTPQAPEVRESCSSGGIAVRVTPDEDIAWSYTLDGGPPVAVDRARTIVPVEEDAAYSVVVTATPVGDATFPEGAQSEWTFEGVRDCLEDLPPQVVPQVPTAAIDCVEGGALVVSVVPDEHLTWSYALDGGAPVEITGATTTVPVVEDASYAVVVTASPVDDATVPAGSQTQWTFEGVRDCQQVQDTGAVPPTTDDTANAPVRGNDRGTGAGALATTGVDPRLGLLSGLLLLLGGTGLVLLVRRRPA